MRPLVLEVEGIRSFRAPQVIDFTGLSFFAILGDTGAGKSSILEAMSYALFNSPTWLDKGVKELMTTGSSSMRVRFKFRVDGRECTITRLTPRAGAAQHLLEYAGDPPERCDSDGAVSRFVRERLRLDRETFMKTVMLPQGRFGELLLMKPADRSKFLSDVLGLQVIEAMADSVRVPREDTAKRREWLSGARRELPADPADALAEAERSALAAQSALKVIDESLQTLGLILKEVEHHRAAVRAMAASLDLLKKGTAAATDLRALAADDTRLRAAIAQRSREVDEADKKRAKTTLAIESRRSTGTDAATLRNVLGNLKILMDQQERLAEERAAEEQAQTDVESLRSELHALTLRLQANRDTENNAEIAVEKARQENQAQRDRVTAASTAAKNISTARAEREVARRALAEAEETLAAAEVACREAETTSRDRAVALEACTEELGAARRAESAAHAADGLHAGDECPVCNRTLPQTFAAPISPKLAEFERRFKAAEKGRDRAQKLLADANAAKNQASLARDQRRKDVDARSKALVRVVGQSAVHGFGESDAKNNRILAEQSKRQTELEKSLGASEIALRDARATREGTDQERVAKDATLRGATDRVTDAQARADKVVATINKVRESVPESSRPAPDATREEIESISSHIQSELAEAEGVEGSSADDERDFSNAQGALAKAKDLWLATVEAPRRDALERAKPVISDVLEHRGFGARIPSPDAEPAVLASFLEAFSAALASAGDHFASELASSSAALAAAEASSDALLQTYGVADMVALRRVRDERLGVSILAGKEVESAIKSRDRAERIDRHLALVEPVAEVFAELADSLTPAQFPKFIVERKQLDLLRVGTTILGRMTNDRYGFSAGLGIVDRSINQERRAHTLSGGETFLASLALSLALVEISERSGVRFESLFLDEGFGTLDPAAFEQALIELEHQVAQGRMIAVITHVARVREFIDDVLHVTKTAEGSEVVREQTAAAS
jgi:exonuclease SbcC